MENGYELFLDNIYVIFKESLVCTSHGLFLFLVMMDFMWSVPDFDFWRTPLDHSKPKLQLIIKRNFILKIAISKKNCNQLS